MGASGRNLPGPSSATPRQVSGLHPYEVLVMGNAASHWIDPETVAQYGAQYGIEAVARQIPEQMVEQLEEWRRVSAAASEKRLRLVVSPMRLKQIPVPTADTFPRRIGDPPVGSIQFEVRVALTPEGA